MSSRPNTVGGVSQLEQFPFRNRLLQAFSKDDFALIGLYLEKVSLPRGVVLIEPNELIEHVYFLEAGIGSVVATNSEKRKVEVSIVGWEGLIGPSIVLGVSHTPHQSFIQVEGFGFRLPAAQLSRAVDRSRTLHGLLLRYVHVLSLQVAATAMSNGDGLIGERLARWLLMCHDRVDGDEVPITHEFLSVMLAVRRAGVTDALHVLEGAQIIQSRRGRITILDRERLAETAGESYGVPEAEYEKLIPGRGLPDLDRS